MSCTVLYVFRLRDLGRDIYMACHALCYMCLGLEQDLDRERNAAREATYNACACHVIAAREATYNACACHVIAAPEATYNACACHADKA